MYVDFISESKKTGIKVIGVHLYDNLFKKIKTFKPSNNKEPDEYYEIQLYDTHYKPLLRWENIRFNKEQLTKDYEKEKEENLNTDTIIPAKKGLVKKVGGKWVKNR